MIMQSPRVNPVGVVEYPAGYASTPRARTPWVRLLAAAVLALFTVASVGTTVYSLGVYCLTTHAGVPSEVSR